MDPVFRTAKYGSISDAPAGYSAADYGRKLVVSIIRWHISIGGVRSALIVEVYVPSQPGSDLRDTILGVQIDFLELDGFPQTLNEAVVSPAALPVPGDTDAVLFQRRCKGQTSELAALISIEDLGCAVAIQWLLQGLDAEVASDRNGYPPAPNFSCTLVDNRHQIHEALRHRYEGNVRRPDLVGPINDEIP